MRHAAQSLSLLLCLAASSARAQSTPPVTPQEPASSAPTAPAPPHAAPTPSAVPAPPAQPAPPAPVVPPPPPKAALIEFTTLRLMREKGVISQTEFDSAMKELGQSVGARGGDSLTFVAGKWATTLYGFVQADVIYHSTQSFNEYAGNLPVARPGTPAGDQSRTQFSARDSRFGFRLQAPELRWLRASALLEMDFLGPSGTIGTTTTEASFFNNPVLRFRHAYFKLETPIVDILFGQTWHLFGFQPMYVPADVQWSGVVGSLFSRTMQLRISKTIKTRYLDLDLAIAGMRPPQRDSSTPEFEGGVRLSIPRWTGVHTLYMTSTQAVPASVAVSGDIRRFSMPQFSATPAGTTSATSLGIAVDAYLPIIPGTLEHKDNALSVVGEFVDGQSINDLYVGLSGGVASPALPGVNGMPGAAFVANIDAGLAVYDAAGKLRLPHWRAFIVGAEYYLPHVGGRIGLFANVARTQLLDAGAYANPTKVRDHELFYNGGIFGDLSRAIRLGVDYAYFDDQYADGVHAINHAVQAVGFFFF